MCWCLIVWLVAVVLPAWSVRNYRPHGFCSPVHCALIRGIRSTCWVVESQPAKFLQATCISSEGVILHHLVAYKLALGSVFNWLLELICLHSIVFLLEWSRIVLFCVNRLNPISNFLYHPLCFYEILFCTS
jgi:hypothetical protein